MSTSFLGLETTLKIPYRDPNFFPSASGPPPLPTPRPVRPSPLDFNRSSRNHIDQVVNGVRQISMSCRTILIMFYLCVPSYHHDAFFANALSYVMSCNAKTGYFFLMLNIIQCLIDPFVFLVPFRFLLKRCSGCIKVCPKYYFFNQSRPQLFQEVFHLFHNHELR